MTRRWWQGLSPAETTLTCSGATHRLRWEAGRLEAPDHGDAESERALAALGGERCACVDILDAWARHASDLRVLVLASRGPNDPLGAREQPSPPPRGPVSGGVRRRARPFSSGSLQLGLSLSPQPGASRPTAPDEELVSLLQLGGGLQDRLVATVAASWAARTDELSPSERARLHAALYGRVTAALRSWLGQPDLDVELELIDGGDPVLGASESGISAELPFSWLVDVWARGLATVWGRFCLEAVSTEGRWTLSTVGPDLGPARAMTLELPGP